MRGDDDELQRDLFDAVLARLETKADTDPRMRIEDRTRDTFRITRNGHLLRYQRDSPSALGSGVIEWKPNPDGDEPYRFKVRRSTFDSAKFQVNLGPELTLEQVVDDIVGTFVDKTS